MKPPRYGAALGWLLALALAIGYLYLLPRPSGGTVDAKRAPEIAREVTVPLVVNAPLQVYKPAVKKKLKLPDAVQRDDARHVVAATLTPNDERRHTITTVLDTRTGVFESYDRVEPLPWLAPNTTTHVAVYYGLKNGEAVVRWQVQQEVLRLKALHVEATASVDTGPRGTDTFIGVGGRWSF